MREPWPERYAIRTLQLLLGYFSIGVGVAVLFKGSKDTFSLEMVETLATIASIPLFYLIPIYGKRISAKRQGWTFRELRQEHPMGIGGRRGQRTASRHPGDSGRSHI